MASESESLDAIRGEAGAPAPEKPGRGGARAGAGRKPKNLRTGNPGASSPSISPPVEVDPDVEAMLADTLANAPVILGQAAAMAIDAIDPSRPASEFEINAMAATAKPVLLKYIGGGASYIGIEGIFALVWLGILGGRYVTKKAPDARKKSADSRPVGNGQDNAGAPASFASELSALAGSGPGTR